MRFPDDKLYRSEAGPSIATLNDLPDPDKPHRFLGRMPSAQYAGGSCPACGGSFGNPIHLEPIGGWPR